MSLENYFKKRDFKKTPEPKNTAKVNDKLVFVIHKHWASRLHYDLRLEYKGVLKSWAVPKGVSTNPEEKRLAIMVEDHPYSYKDFEGIIPEGNYGAGTVMIWDEGTYAPAGDKKNKKEEEEIIKKGLEEGRISFFLYGKKLKGEFVLIRLKGRGENNWLFIKARDEYANSKMRSLCGV
ncbi:3'-phosphoesterase [Candidatus Falkowbacteria bacterium RBG_13_39_14]|uniref:3'-phosphoesterase n=1 Tax=Candidatus Falkowbacteria bacterium RBG_13_39_14 TaxID=1797985 RepID=A0A1F5S4U8_9BACT|nr:MAG: 3'-phosphoesterase [Candidatus Falkowbacteria bacterium RBG_13_39_14]